MQFHNYFDQNGHFAHISCQNKTGKNITTGDFSNVTVQNHPTFYNIKQMNHLMMVVFF